MPRDMIDSQLFGHRRGAFTGATEAFEGVLGAANGGTLFLDEISDLPLDVQPKLLRFLDTGEILRLGEARPTRVDVRILAATNADLEESVAAGRFRRDLYYRLNVLRIHVPPLRERPEDLEVILASFIDKYKDRMSKPKLEFSDAALSLLSMYDWPGNVRQLDGEICRIVTVYDDGCVVQPTDLSREIVQRQTRRRVASAQGSSTAGSRESLADGRRFAERELVEAVLAEENGNMAAAARRLGVSRKGLYLIRSRLGL